MRAELLKNTTCVNLDNCSTQRKATFNNFNVECLLLCSHVSCSVSPLSHYVIELNLRC